MERAWPFDIHRWGIDETNPDHTGMHHPGLQQAAPRGTPEINDPYGFKRVFYTVYKLRASLFRRPKVRSIEGQRTGQYVRPAELHRDEGAQANLYKFISWLCYFRHVESLDGKVRNIHVYTAKSDHEIHLEASLDEILAGLCGKMDENNPLRVIWIPGKKGRFDQPFPSVSRLCGGSKKGVIYLPAPETPHNPPQETEEVVYTDDIYALPPTDESPPTYADDDLPPSYEEVWED